MTDVATTSRPELLFEVEQFIYREVQLLDEHRYDEWLDLFAADGIYWVPSNDESNDPHTHVAIIYNNRDALGKRIARLGIGRAVQEVRSRVAHQVTNIQIGAIDGDEMEVRTVTVVYEVQRSRKNYYPGSCEYRLRQTDDGFSIVSKKLSLIDNDQYYEHLAFMV